MKQLAYSTYPIIWILLALLACSQQQKEATTKNNFTFTIPIDEISKAFDPEVAAQKAAKLDTFFRNLQKTAGFNGTVLVAQNGQIIYKGAFGYKMLSTRDTLLTNTPFQLASVSKQFTSVAILQLIEKGMLSLDDPVSKFIPNFPYNPIITIRLLLTHRSGLPNYVYPLERFYDRTRPLSNSEVVEKLCKLHPNPYYIANRKFNYNNTNYVLLAYIVEKLSGMPFRDYMAQKIFKPLGMNDSFIYDGTDPLKVQNQAATGYTSRRRSFALDYLDSVTGDKSVYSTVEDLWKWDQALCTDFLVKSTTLQQAFVPAHDDTNLITKNYGMGWRLQLLPNGEWLTFHTGWWHGFKNYYLHNPKDRSAIIVLGNVANHALAKINVVQAILYPEKANFFLKIPNENGADDTAMGGVKGDE
jgi:CubicO group peptidase (beta-lactamase class C family)